MTHVFKQKGKTSVCIHCGRTETSVNNRPSRVSASCKVATGKVKAGKLKPKANIKWSDFAC